MPKPSKFNVLIPNFPTTHESLIFNTFSDSRIVINDEVLQFINKIEGQLRFSEEEQENVTLLNNLGFVVDDAVDEDRELEYWFQKLKFDSRRLDLTVLTTSACNLACSYCFEEGINLKGFMSEETCQRLLYWTDQKLQEVRPQVLQLTLFGGEPLMNPKAVRSLSRALHKLTRSKGTKLEIMLITNGVLLDEAVVTELMALGLTRIKVTIDGDEAAHDAKRHYKSGKGSFRKIIDNLLAIKGKAPIAIGGNFDDSTKESIPRFLDYLMDLGFTPDDIMSINFKPILAPTSELAVLNNSMDSGHTCTFSDMNVSDILWLRNEVEKRGFKNSSDGVTLGPCCATREQTYAVDPWGKIYKCVALVGREEYITGDLNRLEDNYQNTRFMTVDLWQDPSCQDCAYRPICGGGCRGSSVSQSGNFESTACEKRYFDNVALELVKKTYDEAVV